jgi:predicted permease
VTRTSVPRWARALARLLIPPASKEFVLGDLEELFHDEVREVGARRATAAYAGRVLRSWLHHVLSGGPLEDLSLDLRFALRGLRRNPTFTLVCAATVAVGVGATTAMLSVADAVLFRPPPIVEPERVASVWELRSGEVWESMEGRLLPYDRFEAYRARSADFFSDVAAHSYARVAIGTEDGAVAVNGFVTSGNYFDLLGLVPALGRLYSDDDEPLIVLSERLWRARFGADPDAVGRFVTVDGRSFQVAGVVGGGFVGTMSTFTGDVWLPWRAFTRLTEVGDRSIRVVPLARLQAGVSWQAADAAVSELARSIDAGPGATVRGARLESPLWRTDLVRVLRVGAALLVAAAALLLVIAAANVGGMMLARACDRRKEIAVRLAMGAGGGRLCLLALLGGGAGVGLAYAGTDWLARVDFPIDATLTVSPDPDGRILALTLVLTLVTGVLYGLGPALRSARIPLSTTRKEGARGLRHGGRRHPFVVAQLVLSTVLLITAGLLVRSLREMTSVPLGFDPRNVTVATVALGTHDYDREQVRLFYERLLEGARDFPGVESVGLARFVMLAGANSSSDAAPVDGDETAKTSVWLNVADPGYFATMRVALADGRLFDERDVDGAPQVVVVNETLAHRFWPDRSAVGGTLRAGRTEYQVVGVVRDGVYGFVYDGPRPYAFLPLAQSYRSGLSLHVRSAAAADPVGPRIRALIRDLDPAVAPSGLRTMDEVVRSNSYGPRFIAGLVALFSVLGLGLAALGVYGLLAVQVAQQSKELGIRMSMGADAREVLLLVLRRGVGFAVVGLGGGVVLAVAGGRLLAPLLYAVTPFDAPTYLIVPALLGATVFLASLVPALRATRVDPLALLRDE